MSFFVILFLLITPPLAAIIYAGRHNVPKERRKRTLEEEYPDDEHLFI
jgi:hypothetical protein